MHARMQAAYMCACSKRSQPACIACMRSMHESVNIFSMYDSTYRRAAKKASQKNFMTATLATAMMMTGRPHAMSCIRRENGTLYSAYT